MGPRLRPESGITQPRDPSLNLWPQGYLSCYPATYQAVPIVQLKFTLVGIGVLQRPQSPGSVPAARPTGVVPELRPLPLCRVHLVPDPSLAVQENALYNMPFRYVIFQ